MKGYSAALIIPNFKNLFEDKDTSKFLPINFLLVIIPFFLAPKESLIAYF